MTHRILGYALAAAAVVFAIAGSARPPSPEPAVIASLVVAKRM